MFWKERLTSTCVRNVELQAVKLNENVSNAHFLVAVVAADFDSLKLRRK